MFTLKKVVVVQYLAANTMSLALWNYHLRPELPSCKLKFNSTFRKFTWKFPIEVSFVKWHPLAGSNLWENFNKLTQFGIEFDSASIETEFQTGFCWINKNVCHRAYVIGLIQGRSKDFTPNCVEISLLRIIPV